MSNIHIYRANDQRAVDYTDPCGEDDQRYTNPANRLIGTDCCYKRRPAKNLIVHVYYDCTLYFCAHEKGCRNPAVLKAQRNSEFRNRSLGNKAAWARRKCGTDSNRRA